MKTININLTNRMLIGLFVIIILLSLIIGTYAYTNPVPNPGHGANQILVSVDGTELTLEQLFNVKRNITWTCASFNLTEGSATTPIFAGSSDGVSYTISEVIEKTGTLNLRCKQENGWTMTDCGDWGPTDNDETMGANDCAGDPHNNPDIISIRCCKINID